MVLRPEFLVLVIEAAFKAFDYLPGCTKKVKTWLVMEDL